MKKKSTVFIIILAMFSCNQRDSGHNQPSNPSIAQAKVDSLTNNDSPTNKDSIEILSLLKSVYQWHAKNQDSLMDFAVTLQDTFQTGLDYEKFNRVFSALQQTHYFSRGFLDNYKKIANYVNHKLTTANRKYSNEINFSFQDIDPWTGFQDDLPDFWNQLRITDYRSAKNSASLHWTVGGTDWTSDKYAVGFARESNQWKVAYLVGFDTIALFK